jgi:uncharacterized protein YeaO (DUF488 family)
MDIQLKHTSEPPARGDGARVLVDRLWPRGRSKDALKLDLWLKDLAPSTELRRWFAHDPEKWPEFRRRYHAELDANPEALEPLRERIAAGPVTLVFAAADREHNNAVALLEWLKAHRRGRR